MKSSLLILLFFVCGVAAGRFELVPMLFIENDFSVYTLYILMFLVGISIGCDKNTLRSIRSQRIRVFLLPLGTIVGTLIGALIVSPLVRGGNVTDVLAVASGFGYYSLSAIMINRVGGIELGTIALLSNVIREMIALIFAPILVRYMGPLSVISAGGATTADTTLPIITRYSGREYVVISVFHGICVDFSVPFLVSLFMAV